MVKILKKLLELLFPKHMTCIICNAELNHNNDNEVCESCQSTLPYSSGKTCECCGMSISSMARVCNRCKNREKTFKFAMSPFNYEDKIVKIVHGLKYKNKKYIAPTMAQYMANCYFEHNTKCDLIIPVPIHENRRKQRGYNQSELLANCLKTKINLPVFCDVLIKHKETEAQASLKYKERQENLKDAFKVVDKSKIKNKLVLLVDDVFTTGATATVCTKALLKAGAKAVIVLCFAHTVIE